jgi:hypothetical protein
MQKAAAFPGCANAGEAARDLCLEASHERLLKSRISLDEECRLLQTACAYRPAKRARVRLRDGKTLDSGACGRIKTWRNRRACLQEQFRCRDGDGCREGYI